MLSEEARQVAKELLADKVGSKRKRSAVDPIFPGTKAWWQQATRVLQMAVATDPVRLPPVTLYSLRHFFCTQMYLRGTPSAFIMAQMHHKAWQTSCLYIHSERILWQDKFNGQGSDSFIPSEAKQMPPVQEPKSLLKWVHQKRDPERLAELWDGVEWLQDE